MKYSFITNLKKKTHRARSNDIEKFKKIDLEMNIEKCEFFKKQMIYLNVIFSINDFRMNLKKIQIIID